MGWWGRLAVVLLVVQVVGCSKDNNVDVGVACTSGELRCQGVAMEQCAETGDTWLSVDLCRTATLCEIGMAGRRCAMPVCTEGERRCEGALMWVCAEGQDRLDAITCATPEECVQGLSNGTCAGECQSPGDCQGEATSCAWPSCLEGSCGKAFADYGTMTPDQVPGDCKSQVCDGSGLKLEVADDDPPQDTECTRYDCVEGQLVTSYEQEETPCGGGGTCDGTGTCSTCQPSAVGTCASSAAQTVCSATGVWEQQSCPALRGRCDDHDGQCYGGGKMVWIPAASGASYGIDATEVTRNDYQQWLQSGPNTSGQPAECSWNDSYVPSAPAGNLCGWPPGAQGDRPVVCVDWCDAYAYCHAVGKRLCGAVHGGPSSYGNFTDATNGAWYRACSAGGQHNFPYGGSPSTSNLDGYEAKTCNGADYGAGGLVTVGSLSGCASSVPGYGGVHDQSGNAKEWEDACDAQGGAQDRCRLRGGNFGGASNSLTCSSPSYGERSAALDTVGFRCCSP